MIRNETIGINICNWDDESIQFFQKRNIFCICFEQQVSANRPVEDMVCFIAYQYFQFVCGFLSHYSKVIWLYKFTKNSDPLFFFDPRGWKKPRGLKKKRPLTRRVVFTTRRVRGKSHLSFLYDHLINHIANSREKMDIENVTIKPNNS